jgi:hypothetical protein
MIEGLLIEGKPAQLLEREPIETLLERTAWSARLHQVWTWWQEAGMVARIIAGRPDAGAWVFYEFEVAEKCPDPYYGRYLMIRCIAGKEAA